MLPDDRDLAFEGPRPQRIPHWEADVVVGGRGTFVAAIDGGARRAPVPAGAA